MANKTANRVYTALLAPPVITLNMTAIWTASVVLWCGACVKAKRYIPGLWPILARETRDYLEGAKVEVLKSWG